MTKLCIVPGCNNPIWGKGYCKYHQYLRSDISTVISNKPRKAIKKLSVKRTVQNEAYISLKNKSVLEARKKGKIKCFFCNKDINGIPDWHHLDGREENKLTDTSRLVFVHRKCHGKIHDLSYEMLSRLPCYESYLMRLKAVDELLYFKEYEKRNK
jgi:hypothetical protein